MSDDYIKRENAKRAVWGCTRDTGIDEAPFEYAEGLLKDVPSEDVAPVVRCKDCASFRYSGMGGDNGITYCARLIMTEMQPTDFCSYGERKDNE